MSGPGIVTGQVNPFTGRIEIPVEELADQDYGQNVVLNGTAATLTAVDLSSYAEENDLLVVTLWCNNSSATTRQCDVYKDSGGTKHIAIFTALGTGSGKRPTQMMTSVIRVNNPATSLYYQWTTVPTGGFSVWIRYRVPAKFIAWS